MQILSKFCHNKHLTREMVPLRINTTYACSANFIKTGYAIYCPPFGKNIIINSKASKYQQNYKQTILP